MKSKKESIIWVNRLKGEYPDPLDVPKKFTGIVAYKSPTEVLDYWLVFPYNKGDRYIFRSEYSCDECGYKLSAGAVSITLDLYQSRNRLRDCLFMSGHFPGSSCIKYLREKVENLEEIIKLK